MTKTIEARLEAAMEGVTPAFLGATERLLELYGLYARSEGSENITWHLVLTRDEPEFGADDATTEASLATTREALKKAVDHIDHMAAWVSKQNAGYSFESLGEDMPGIHAALAGGEQS